MKPESPFQAARISDAYISSEDGIRILAERTGASLRFSRQAKVVYDEDVQQVDIGT